MLVACAVLDHPTRRRPAQSFQSNRHAVEQALVFRRLDPSGRSRRCLKWLSFFQNRSPEQGMNDRPFSALGTRERLKVDMLL
jgi:hypothetical protein